GDDVGMRGAGRSYAERAEALEGPALVGAARAGIEDDDTIARLESRLREELVHPRLGGGIGRQPKVEDAVVDAERVQEREVLIDHVAGRCGPAHASVGGEHAQALAAPARVEAEAERRPSQGGEHSALAQALQVAG